MLSCSLSWMAGTKQRMWRTNMNVRSPTISFPNLVCLVQTYAFGCILLHYTLLWQPVTTDGQEVLAPTRQNEGDQPKWDWPRSWFTVVGPATWVCDKIERHQTVEMKNATATRWRRHERNANLTYVRNAVEHRYNKVAGSSKQVRYIGSCRSLWRWQ